MTVRIEIDTKDFEEKLNEAKKHILFRLVNKLQDRLTKEHGKDTGALSISISNLSKVTNDGIEINMLERGKFLEFGTPPHMPPVEELEGWADRKLGDKDLAWAVAMGIKKRGTRPYPFIRPTFHQDANKIVKEELQKAFHTP